MALWRDSLRLFLWRTLSVCCISEAIAYGFHLFLTSLQEASFYGVKGRLSKGKKPCIEG
jgi:uncharacterized membrane protein YcgQ (UPF0703/DUF1980 family)